MYIHYTYPQNCIIVYVIMFIHVYVYTCECIYMHIYASQYLYNSIHIYNIYYIMYSKCILYKCFFNCIYIILYNIFQLFDK